ncbi:MAG TPA: hypothetical protein VNZ52_12730 [Candidatus Thermoplasmatota archaeon]|nr:hypothetical protein [Candidatus Thermoplasmatota archaeon]
MRRSLLLTVSVAYLLVGSLQVVHEAASGSLEPQLVEVRLGALAPGSSPGLSFTRGSASVTGGLLSVSTNVLYLNNTNATGASYAKLALSSSSGLANLALVEVGLNNGTQTAQVTGSLGSITQTSGGYVQLPPGSVNRIYVTRSVSTTGLLSTLVLDLKVADHPDERAFVVSRVTISVA